MAARSHSKLLAAQTCSRGGARSLRGPPGGGGQVSPIFTAQRGEEPVGVTQTGSQGESCSCGGQSLHVERGAHPGKGRQETKFGNLNLILF